MMRQACSRTGFVVGSSPCRGPRKFHAALRTWRSALKSTGALRSGSSRSPCREPLQSSFHLAMVARLSVHGLADRKAFAPQDLAALLITLDPVSHSAGRLLFSSGGQLVRRLGSGPISLRGRIAIRPRWTIGERKERCA
jgi:hypothetical protein